MSGFIEFCVELNSGSEGGAAGETDREDVPQSADQEGRHKNGRGGRRGMLHRQNSVVCSRVHTLNTISYVDTGECIIGRWLGNDFYFCHDHKSVLFFQEKKSNAWSPRELHPFLPGRHPRTRLSKWRRVWNRVKQLQPSAAHIDQTWSYYWYSKTWQMRLSTNLTCNHPRGPRKSFKCYNIYLFVHKDSLAMQKQYFIEWHLINKTNISLRETLLQRTVQFTSPLFFLQHKRAAVTQNY